MSESLVIVGSQWVSEKSGKKCQVVKIDDWAIKVKYPSGAARWVLTNEFLKTHRGIGQ